MARRDVRRGSGEVRSLPQVTNRAHPRIYTILIGLAVWFVFAIWSFAGGGVTDYLLFIVSGFIGLSIVLPLILFHVGRVHGASTADDGQLPLRDWVRWDYDTSTGRLRGSQAAAEILLPIAAAAVGMTAIGIAFHFAGG